MRDQQLKLELGERYENAVKVAQQEMLMDSNLTSTSADLETASKMTLTSISPRTMPKGRHRSRSSIISPRNAFDSRSLGSIHDGSQSMTTYVRENPALGDWVHECFKIYESIDGIYNVTHIFTRGICSIYSLP